VKTTLFQSGLESVYRLLPLHFGVHNIETKRDDIAYDTSSKTDENDR